MERKINRVYTRTGDEGETGLIGDKRTSKANLLIEAYGTIDELNSAIGFARDHLDDKTIELKPVLIRLQQELFDLGSEVATPASVSIEGIRKCEPRNTTALEELCDMYNEGLPELHSFILPGGSRLCSSLHMARTICRRCERAVVRYNEVPSNKEKVSGEVVKYLNRLSDALFVLSRWVLHKQGIPEVLWVMSSDRELV